MRVYGFHSTRDDMEDVVAALEKVRDNVDELKGLT